MRWNGASSGQASPIAAASSARFNAPRAMPAPLYSMAAKVERYGLKAAQLLHQLLPLPCRPCRAGDEHDAVECLWRWQRLALISDAGNSVASCCRRMIVVAVRSVILDGASASSSNSRKPNWNTALEIAADEGRAPLGAVLAHAGARRSSDRASQAPPMTVSSSPPIVHSPRV